jgi:dUTP pyrophosphatase
MESRRRYERTPRVGKSIPVKKLEPNAVLPEKNSDGASAYDLRAIEDVELKPFQVVKVRTGLAMEIPKGSKGEIYSRSGLASKGVMVVNQPGKIDSDYRGEICVLLMYVPKDTTGPVQKLYKALATFARNLTSTNQITLNDARNRLLKAVSNSPYDTYKISAGDRIAQFEINTTKSVTFSETEELEDTQRGEGGFGSTGT